MINWFYFPQWQKPPEIVIKVVREFELQHARIESGIAGLKSDQVLAVVCPGLQSIGFQVETAKTPDKQIRVPVLFGRNGRCEKSFKADAYHPQERMVLEVEAGRGVVNNQFLKDLFQACVMQDVDFLGIAVCNIYGTLRNFEEVIRFMQTLYASERLKLPLKGILIVGY